MEKILFVNLTNFYITPYFNNYVEGSNIEFDVVFWDRAYLNEKISKASDIFYFHTKNYSDSQSRLKKLFQYYLFSIFLKKKIRRGNYTKIVFLQTPMAVFLASFLKRKFKNKYIIDIRDYSFEGISFYRFLEQKAIHNSAITFISSEGYKNFLPNYDYHLVHNYKKIDLETRSKFFRKKSQMPIVISFIGLIRFMDQNKRIIDFFGNDERFRLNFIGKNALELQDYVNTKGINNVFLHDYFDPIKTLDYYYETDLIMNLYGNANPLLDYAISNKLYYSASLYIPILVCPNTYMEEITYKYGMGFSLDLDDKNQLDILYDYFLNIDRNLFKIKCDEFINSIENDMLDYKKELSKFYGENM